MIEIKDIVISSSSLKLTDALEFSLTFDAFSELDELVWRVTHTPEGDAGQAAISLEQQLESVEVGPVPKGINTFKLEVRLRMAAGAGTNGTRAELTSWLVVAMSRLRRLH